jgi:hypothetical protein
MTSAMSISAIGQLVSFMMPRLAQPRCGGEAQHHNGTDEDRRAVGGKAARSGEYRRLPPNGRTTPTSRRPTGLRDLKATPLE